SKSTSTTGGGATTTTAAALPSGGTVTYAAEQEFDAYNNSSSDNGLFANTLVLNMVQPAPFIFDGALKANLNSDMMASAEAADSTSPQVLTYKIKPEAVWSDGQPIDCSDFYLAWLSQNAKAKAADGSPMFKWTSSSGYEQISKIDCSADGKTVTATFDADKPF